MGYEYFIARRYLTARRKQAFVSVITFVSVLGITIGVAALIIAIGLITGFQTDVRDKILSATSHLMVQDLTGEGLADYESAAGRIRALPGVRSVSPVAMGWGLLTGPTKISPAMIKGLDLEAESREAAWLRRLESGALPRPDAPRGEVLLGRDLAFSLGAGVGDVVTVLSTSSTLSPLGLWPKSKRLVVSGIYATGLYEFDSGTAIVPLAAAQKDLGLEGRVSYLQVMISDIFAAGRFKAALQDLLPAPVFVTTWMELNKSLFSALKLEKNLMFLTIALIVVVAALNIIATLILMVMEKTRDIGVLIAVGAAPRSVQKIFFLQGTLIGLAGTALGTLLGLGWCALANAFKLIRVPVDIYQISFVPFRVRPQDLALIIGVSLLISLLSTLFPSRRAAKTDPVVALKYE